MLAIASIAAPAFAQEADAEFSGPYIGVSAGQTSVKNRTSVDPVQFDTNRDGTYGDPVLTSTNANAFAPGFCAVRMEPGIRIRGRRPRNDLARMA